MVIKYKKAKCINFNNRYYLNLKEFLSFDRCLVDEFIEYSKKNIIDHPSIIKIDKSTLLVSRKDDSKLKIKETDLPFGNYILEMDYSLNAAYVEPISEIYSDKYVNLNDKTINIIESNIDKFLLMGEKYKSLNLIHKRGYLLYGPPGNGKTMLIKHITQKYQDSCYIIYIRGRTEWEYVSSIRSKFENSIVFFIIEELTIQTTPDRLDEVLNFLDGTFSWNNCVIFATTNNPELLPNNIVDRPSRFDMVLKFDNPSDDIRRMYIKHILGKYTNQMVRLSQGHSLAYLKELCILSLLYDKKEFDESLNGINIFQDHVKSKKNGEGYVS